MRLINRYKILFLIVIVLGTYYKAISGTINSIDDVHILDAYGVNSNLTLRDIFTPGKNFYYRPLIELSYYLDYRLWGLDASFMHLENLIIHVVNSFLIFQVGTRIIGKTAIRMPDLPLLSALLFAVHPINTEAVSWIAGRTDPLTTLFVLLSLYFLLKALDNGCHWPVYLSLCALLIACLAKEIAVLFFPASLLIVICCSTESDSLQAALVKHKKILLPFLIAALMIFALSVLHYIYRTDTNSVSKLLVWKSFDLYNTLAAAFTTFGFYVKKFIFPLPLNFAIVSVSKHYIWLGIIVSIAMIPLALKRHVIYVFLVVGFFFITPALIVSFAQMNWTLVAERYLYLPSVFLSIGFVGSCYMVMDSWERRTSWLTPLTSILVILAAVCTMQRILVWQDNLALYQDTVKKSPDFGAVRNELAVALINKGRIDEGREQLRVAKRLNNRDEINCLIDLNLLALELRGKTPEQAGKVLHNSIKDKRSANLDVLNMLKKVDEGRLINASDMKLKISIAKEIIDTNEHIFAKTRAPICYYRNGQLALFTGDKPKAASYFKYAYNLAPDDAYFKKSARTLADMLAKK